MQSLELPCRYGTLAALSWGQTNAEPVLALHGWLDNAASFAALGPVFAEAFPGRRLLAVDLPGHGFSPRLSGGATYPFWMWSEVLVDLLTFFGRPLHVIGHSMGGAASLLVAGSCPELLRSLVSIDALGPITASPEQASVIFRKAMLEPARGSSSGFASEADALALRQKATPYLTLQQLEPLVTRNLEYRAGRWHWRTDARLRSHSRTRFSEDMLASFLRAAALPVAVVYPERSIIPADICAQRLALLPRGVLFELPGHHHCHMDSSSLPVLMDRLARFYNETDAQG
jgi:pimeloyl-ACP methyl ester carboxylesterase